jgi:hypothetical protein
VKEKPTVGSPFWGRFLLTPSLKRKRIAIYIYFSVLNFPLAEIPVNRLKYYIRLYSGDTRILSYLTSYPDYFS